MTRDEVLRKLEEARSAIRSYQSENLGSTYLSSEMEKVQRIKKSSSMLITEARAIGAAGEPCPRCGGSGRV